MTAQEPKPNAPLCKHEEGEDEDLLGLASLVHEIGFLKSVPRTGWIMAGIHQPESVADHSLRVAAIAYMLATLAGADAGRAASLAIFHDLAETRTGDIPSVGKPYLKKESDEAVVAEQVAGSPAVIRALLGGLVAEYAHKQSDESRLAHDADKLECLAQALQYAAEGHPQANLWVTGMYESVGTPAGKRLAEALLHSQPDAWWKDVVVQYRRSLPARPEPQGENRGVR